MRKLLIALLFIVGCAFATKPIVFEICTPQFCYTQAIQDAKKWEYKYDFNGRKFIRVYFYDKWKLLDIAVDNKQVKQKKN